MKTPIRRSSRRCGFTLVELMVVVTIVGVMASIVYMRLDNLIPGQRLRAAAMTVAGTVDLARSETRFKQSPVTLCYDFDKRTISIIELPAPPTEEELKEAGAAAMAPRSNEPQTVFSETLPKGVSIKEIFYSDTGIAVNGLVPVDFHPSGAVGEHMIVLREDSGATVAVYVPGLSGSAFVVDDGATYGQIRASRRLQ